MIVQLKSKRFNNRSVYQGNCYIFYYLHQYLFPSLSA